MRAPDTELLPFAVTLDRGLETPMVGMGSIVARDLDDRLYRDLGAWIGGLCVLRDHRGKGLAGPSVAHRA
jgi:hypothetical protein